MLPTRHDPSVWRGPRVWSTECFQEEAYAVAAALQRLVGVAYFGSRERFEAVVRQTARTLPNPSDALGELWLRETLRNASFRAALAFHRNQGGNPACGSVPAWEQWGIWWNAPTITARAAFARSLARFLKSFDSQHRHIGVPVRTAKLLRRSRHVTRTMEVVARRMGCSRSRMEALFHKRYGLTVRAYHDRVRLRAAILHLRRTDDKIEYVARRAGFATDWTFGRALKRLTGLAPGTIRTMDPPELESLLERYLEIDIGTLYERREGRG